ncbi:Hypothetical predicted protein [Mytilus galloprovincialis]|uniref:Apextrin C-terminal domain-containing protein n=1 Tax=Mytilus galloprovincialis TaxID=29158 RepID=A0A8B6BZW2_MYTGA|nr:Hypothetical predicted protein [Mytilus galloprovincialis]
MMSTWTLFFLFQSVMAVSWPPGTYTLIKPQSGCPLNWQTGWRYQDNEDKNNINSLILSQNLIKYLSLNSHFNPGIDPAFILCNIYKKSKKSNLIFHNGEPTRFRTGSIYWDDEDSNNANDKGGVLPSGTYNRNTRINYCCRSDGSYSGAIRLPTSRPFYLLRITSSCQRVIGMNVREEYVMTDDEDNNNANSVSGSHPFKSGTRNTQLHYCYYY